MTILDDVVKEAQVLNIRDACGLDGISWKSILQAFSEKKLNHLAHDAVTRKSAFATRMTLIAKEDKQGYRPIQTANAMMSCLERVLMDRVYFDDVLIHNDDLFGLRKGKDTREALSQLQNTLNEKNVKAIRERDSVLIIDFS